MLSNHNYKYLALFFCCLHLTLSGCSSKPWLQTAISEPDQSAYQQILDKIIAQNERCENKFDGEAVFTLTSSLHNRSIQGYLATITPSRAKFIVSSPLGHPFYIATINDKQFQAINVANATYNKGNVTELINLFTLPAILAEMNIGMILDCRISNDFTMNNIFRDDRKKRGIWFSRQHQKMKEHILFDPNKQLVIARMIEDEKGEQLTIIYSKHQQLGKCQSPRKITISGLSYGTEISIILKDVLAQPLFTEKDFTIKIPPNFVQQPLR